MYCKRLIDKYLQEWVSRDIHKLLLLRGARQVGKSTAVQELAKRFESFVEINFEKQPQYKAIFNEDLDVKRIVSQIWPCMGFLFNRERLCFSSMKFKNVLGQ